MKTIYITLIVFLGIAIFTSCEIDPLETGGKELAEIELEVEKAWGTEYTDDFAGSVMDNSGNLYFVGSTSGDGFTQKLFLNKVDISTGELVWSKSYESSFSNFFPSPSENGISQGGGGSRCIAIDDAGNVYIAGTTVQGYNQVFVMKISSAGNVMWQRNYDADDSGLAKGSAKAYAIDVNNDRVYVTGSTGAGTSNEEAMSFLLIFDANSGDVSINSTMGLDLSDGYNDKGYVVQATDDGLVYIAGWEGQSNSGFIARFSENGDTFDWAKRVALGTGHRFTDLDIDSNGDLYLSVDFRGVSTYLGVLKLDANGSYIWGKQFQGEPNDRNNISCLRLLNGYLYVGGKGSFEKYDLSEYGDACVLKLDLSGNIISQYNYFTGDEEDERCGERIEGMHFYDGKLILAGETWPKYGHIQGHWYTPEANFSDFNPSISSISDFSRISGTGYVTSETFSPTANTNDLFDLVDGNQGSSDIVIFSITE